MYLFSEECLKICSIKMEEGPVREYRRMCIGLRQRESQKVDLKNPK
jgi:hypothetical protein